METSFNIDRDLIVFDLETSGVNVNKSGMIQLGAWKLQRNLEIDKLNFDVYIKPYVDEWREASAEVHGISKEFLESNGITLHRALKNFVQWSEPSKKYYLATWGSNFDISILSRDFIASEIFFPFSYRTYDIASIVRFYLALHGVSSCSLAECAQVLGISTSGLHLHNAKDDAFLTALVLRRVVEDGYRKINFRI